MYVYYDMTDLQTKLITSNFRNERHRIYNDNIEQHTTLISGVFLQTDSTEVSQPSKNSAKCFKCHIYILTEMEMESFGARSLFHARRLPTPATGFLSRGTCSPHA